MRLVISDTGPINYLVLIGHIEILPALFERIVLPVAVEKELKDTDAPHQVRQWMLRPPHWLEVRGAPALLNANYLSAALDEGEREAILLADVLNADTLLLIDNRTAVRAARQKGLAVTGTIGILEEAAQLGLLDLATAFDRLRLTSFHCTEELMQNVLARHKQGRS